MADQERQQTRRSIFFPILLIAIGALFLARNLDLIPGTGWDFLVRMWPALLIMAGLDDLIRRKGIAWPVFADQQLRAANAGDLVQGRPAVAPGDHCLRCGFIVPVPDMVDDGDQPPASHRYCGRSGMVAWLSGSGDIKIGAHPPAAYGSGD